MCTRGSFVFYEGGKDWWGLRGGMRKQIREKRGGSREIF